MKKENKIGEKYNEKINKENMIIMLIMKKIIASKKEFPQRLYSSDVTPSGCKHKHQTADYISKEKDKKIHTQRENRTQKSEPRYLLPQDDIHQETRKDV